MTKALMSYVNVVITTIRVCETVQALQLLDSNIDRHKSYSYEHSSERVNLGGNKIETEVCESTKF